ncbi:uncharacterized protein KGF55_000233 [Candida pseudojiufengensis]|uniref:uncharacterized protein n=1 Tax=Candida pseudojiufengensis TaxID=497109 RepID=UPI0022242E90|nr:uncharacterized protein KGF55_000233 [Candida pseudojiufengensis]KAI5966824.1 hypothetical protein KGF55_000233 [Candida pseudojiufengensis]
MESRYSESTISKWEEKDQEEGIKFDENNLENQELKRGRSRKRRFSIHSRSNSLNKIFPIKEKSDPSNVLPGIFKTISHKVDLENEQKESTVTSKFSSYTYNSDSIDDIATKFSTNLIHGLSDYQYQENSKLYGENKQSKPPNGLLKKLFMYFFGGFGALLLAGGILCIISWKPLGNPNPAVANLVLGIILIVVFLIQAAFNFIQDYSSSKVMNSIHNLVASDCAVIRNGKPLTIDSVNLVPGDVVKFSPGVKIPADVRIISNSPDLSFDRAILTGESKPVVATSYSDEINSNYLESSCIGMQGSFCLNGTGRGIVVSTGDDTIFGSIAKMTSQPRKGLSPLQKEIFYFVAFISGVILFLVILTIIIWCTWLHKDCPDWINVSNLIIDLVSFAVATIPESLPVSIAFVLLLTAYKMKQQQILVKSLHMCGTLASCSVLCFDKTGTLTQNNMKVVATCLGDEDDAEVVKNHAFTIGTLCNESHIVNNVALGGNATDRAILQYIEDNVKSDTIRDKWIKKLDIPFNSKDKYMLSLVEPKIKKSLYEVGFEESESYLLLVKSAPDVLIDNCKFIMTETGITPLNLKKLNYLKDLQKQWSSNGKRVILLSSKLIHKEAIDLFDRNLSANMLKDEIESGLIFMGLIAIEDPPRKAIDKVINTLRKAGIKIVMITGDYELTGVSIAKQCGIVTTEKVDKLDTLGLNNLAVSITGKELNQLNESQWEQLVNYDELVFTRTTPEQKLLIIKQFQKFKHCVGMTGDGINDSPALKQADIGISLIDASDIAKEAADLILMNSDGDKLFLSIVEALKFGRLVFENLKKTIAYLLPAGSYAECWPIIMNVFFGFPQMLSSFLMIIICCLTDCCGSIVLAFEEAESNLLTKKPRILTNERLVDWKLMFHSYICLGTFYTFTSFMVSFLNLTRRGYKFNDFALSFGSYESLPNIDHYLAMSSSIYFINLVIMQVFNLISLRTRHLSLFQHSILKNKKVIFVIPFVLMVNFIINYIPAIQNAMGTSQIPVEYYFIAIGFGLVVFGWDELRKFIVRKYPKGIVAKFAW